MFLSHLQKAAHSNDAQNPQAVSVKGYTRMICDNAYESERHYEKQNPPYIDIPLTDKCFSGFIGIPKKWKSWQTQMKGSNAGDWAAEWYNGWNNPAGPFTAAQINSGRINFNNVSYEARFQGKGTLRMYRITGDTRPTSPGTSSAEMEETGPDTPPILPTSGGNEGYSFVMERCARSGEAIKCWGYATNKTDATSDLHFKDSHAVDDEGHSFFVGIIGGGFHFANDIHEKLSPGTKTRFFVKVPDPHMNVKKLTLQLNTEVAGNYDHFVFDVPVQ
jgi:hypothetical protein